MESTLRILLIEDNPADARLIRELFAEIGHGFTFEYADRLSTGIEKLHGQYVDAILLDLLLPDSMGLDTFKQVRAQLPQAP